MTSVFLRLRAVISTCHVVTLSLLLHISPLSVRLHVSELKKEVKPWKGHLSNLRDQTARRSSCFCWHSLINCDRAAAHRRRLHVSVLLCPPLWSKLLKTALSDGGLTPPFLSTLSSSFCYLPHYRTVWIWPLCISAFAHSNIQIKQTVVTVYFEILCSSPAVWDHRSRSSWLLQTDTTYHLLNIETQLHVWHWELFRPRFYVWN